MASWGEEMRATWFYVAGLVGVITIGASAPGPASAQDVNRIIGTLNAILNPQDAARLEERARREGREEERQYWRDYRAGLEQRRPEPEGAYREGYRQGYQFGAEDARRYEEEARRRHRYEEERYWRAYRAGLEHGREEGRVRYGIGPDEARGYEEQARIRHRLEEERYWRDYRAGLGEAPPPPGDHRPYGDQRYR
jgi:hypothetical protein